MKFGDGAKFFYVAEFHDISRCIVIGFYLLTQRDLEELYQFLESKNSLVNSCIVLQKVRVLKLIKKFEFKKMFSGLQITAK